MTKLNEIVSDLLNQYKGGHYFFDKLDSVVQNNDIIGKFVDMIRHNHKFTDELTFICSGKFGYFIRNLATNNIVIPNYWNIIVVSGGLRHKPCDIDDLSYLDLNNKKFIFLDDSFYKGRTRDCIKNELIKNNAELIHTYVIYDGSKKKDKTVTSLYRYHKE